MLPSLAPARHLASAVFVGLVVLASCSDSTDNTSRTCHDKVVAYAPPEGRPCGEKISLTLDLCERTVSDQCAPEGTQNLVCLSSAGDHGFLVELSRCGTVESLPDGWSLAAEYAAGVNAEKECNTARTLCSGGTLSGGAGTTGAGGTGGS